MDIYEVIWRNKFVEKLADKHNVSTDEVEEVLFRSPFIRFWEKGETAARIYTWLTGKPMVGAI